MDIARYMFDRLALDMDIARCTTQRKNERNKTQRTRTHNHTYTYTCTCMVRAIIIFPH